MKPKAFVLMSFSEDMDDVFTDLIKAPLQEGGYDVQRADDISSSASIIGDIVQGIENAELIVADLTHQNPNVYYELGLSHARSRPTILLAQDLEEVPFDLRPYRIIEYGIDFKGAEKLKKTLLDRAVEAAEGQLRFGSPISDFLGIPVKTPLPISDEPKGVIDKLADFEQASEDNVASLRGVGAVATTLSEDMKAATIQLNEINQASSPNRYRDARRVSQRLATKLIQGAKKTEAISETAESAIDNFQGGIDHFLSITTAKEELSPDEIQGLETLLTVAESTHTSTQGLATEINRTLAQLAGLRGNQQLLNAALARYDKAGRRYGAIIKRYAALYRRTIEVLKNYLSVDNDNS